MEILPVERSSYVSYDQGHCEGLRRFVFYCFTGPEWEKCPAECQKRLDTGHSKGSWVQAPRYCAAAGDQGKRHHRYDYSGRFQLSLFRNYEKRSGLCKLARVSGADFKYRLGLGERVHGTGLSVDKECSWNYRDAGLRPKSSDLSLSGCPSCIFGDQNRRKAY